MKKQNKTKKEFLFLVIGIILIFFGIYLSVFKKEPHFYTPFSIGMVLVSISVYRIFSKKKLFENWKIKRYILFFGILLLSCIIADKVGIYLGYWIDNYHSFFDIFLKYVFEWTVPFISFMIFLMIGLDIFEKKFSFWIAFVLSLIIFVIPLGFLTEYINLFSDSWIVLSMPFSNFKIGDFFIIFQFFGYPFMAIIPFIIYKISEKIK
jgi:hypothetical protein